MSQNTDIAELTAALKQAQALIDAAKKPKPEPTPEPEESQEPDIDCLPTPERAEEASQPESETEDSDPIGDPLEDEYGDPYTFTEKGAANGLNQRYWAAALEDQARFENLGKEGAHYRYEGRIWKRTTKQAAARVVYERVHQFERRRRAAGMGAAVLGKLLSIRNLSGVVDAIESFNSADRIFDDAPEGIILTQNGRLELGVEGVEFQQGGGGPEDLQRRIFPADYDPQAEAPRLMGWLQRIFRDREDDIKALQRFAGACLYGSNIWKKYLVIEGHADAGKGTLLNLFERIAGEDCTEALRTKYLEDRFETNRFVGKTLIVAGDVPENFLMLPGAGKIKEMVGDDRIPVEKKGSDSGGYMRGRFNIAVVSNFRVKVMAGADNSAHRTRLVYLIADGKPFGVGEVDRKFLENLWQSEGAGILNWALGGLRMLLNEGDWLLSERQQQLRDDIIDESASISSFVSERLEESPEGRGGVTTDGLFAGYKKYCTEKNWTGFPEHYFVRHIPDAIYSRFRVSGSNKVEIEGGRQVRGYPGIRLKSLDKES